MQIDRNIECKLATYEDIPAIVAMGKQFFGESQYSYLGIEFSEKVTEMSLYETMKCGLFPIILATKDKEVIGGISLMYDYSFSEKPIAILQYIFVEKPYRKGLVGRMLVHHAIEIAKGDGATSFFAPINSGTGAVRSLANLFRKGGFLPSGVILSRSL
jgi:GNAT superfamily N-acetyltransferase